MDSKFFDIPFRLPSSYPDFSCKDGELAEALNVKISATSGKDIGEWADGIDPSAENTTDLQLEAPLIDFAIVRDILDGWHLLPDNYPMKTLVASEPTMEYWNKLAAQLLTEFNSEATLQNKYVAPFMAMAAWKSVTGRYLAFSTPVMLTPNSAVPLVATDGAIDSKELQFKIAGAVGSLYFKLKAPETLRDWVGRISHLEILVSEPLQKYDSYKVFLPYSHVMTDSYCESLDPESGEVARRRICTETLPLAWKASEQGVATGELAETPTGEGLNWHAVAQVALKDVDLAGDWTSASGPGGIAKIVNGLYGAVSYEKLQENALASEKSVIGAELAIIEGRGEGIRVITRPMKLTGAGLLKRFGRLSLRGRYTPSNLTISVYGSRDMLKWWCISRRRGGTMAACPSAPQRFYRVEVSGLLGSAETLEGLSFH